MHRHLETKSSQEQQNKHRQFQQTIHRNKIIQSTFNKIDTNTAVSKLPTDKTGSDSSNIADVRTGI